MQVHGTAMGTCMAPSSTHLYIGKLEQEFLRSQKMLLFVFFHNSHTLLYSLFLLYFAVFTIFAVFCCIHSYFCILLYCCGPWQSACVLLQCFWLLQVHPIKGKGEPVIAANIEHIISRAERDIVNSLISHYDELGETITAELKNMETQLGSHPDNNKGAIQSILQTMEKEEDDLSSSLERSRKNKLRDLLKDTTPTPTRKGKFPKGTGPYLRKP